MLFCALRKGATRATMHLFYFVSLLLGVSILSGSPSLSLRADLKIIVVSRVNGTDNSTCWNETTVPCQTLNYALKHMSNSTFVRLRSEEYSYNLTEHFNFTGLREIGLIGDEEAVSVDCFQNGSLSFVGSENITLERILLRGCGGLHNSTTGDAFKKYARIPFLSAVYLSDCKDVIVNNFSIVQSPGIGLNMYDVGGEVRISYSRFESNQPLNSTPEDIAVAGGGVYIEFTFKSETNMSAFPSDLTKTPRTSDSNSTYIFHYCTFRDNLAKDQKFSTFIDNPHGNDHIPFGRGGGLSIFVKGVAQNNVIQITHCHFEDNYALWGGGIFVEFQDKVQNNTLEINNCNFTNNNATYAGGAIRSGTIAHSNHQQLLPNQVMNKGCLFTSNSAVLGGGVSHHGIGSLLKVENNKSLNIQFTKCHWTNNTATMGSAIGLAGEALIIGSQDLTSKGPRLVHSIILEDCNITNNRIVLTEDGDVIGQGAIYSYSVPVIFQGVVNIESNNNTAVVTENVMLHVVGNVTFRNNTGGQGGALGLYGTSVIMLMPDSNLKFFDNVALQQGGAIYVRDSGPPVVAFKTTELNTRPCFIAFNNTFSLEGVNKWKTRVIFKGNHALQSGGGKSVYASTLQGCRQAGQPRINNESLQWHNVIEYQDPDISAKEQISTDPVKIKLIESEWGVSPSEVFNASVELIDEKNSSVLGIVNLTITDNNDRTVKLGTTSNLFLIQGNSPKINNLHLLGKVHSKFKVQASTVAGRVVQFSFPKPLQLQFCHPGLEQKSGEYSCTCLKQLGISHCSDDFKFVFLKRGYWGGTRKEKKNEFSTYPCPPDYCHFAKHDPNFQYNPNTLCVKGRNGSSVLCGACKNNYSVNLGNENCTTKCDNTHLWLLVVFFIVTLFLVLVVLRIQLDIFTTYLNTWLYSYQVITFLLQEGQYLDRVIKFVIGIANWRIKGVGTCLFHGMNNLQKLGINYILPSYVLLLLLILAKVAKCRPTCYINRNVSRALCTLLVLCYTNITMISCNIIHYVPIQGRWVLYADGNIDFIRNWKEHLPFTIIACLWFILFVAFVPLVLLFTPWFMRHFKFLNNFRLFFDTFQQCFKDEYRWFAAFYFLCRIYILFIALFVPFSPLKRSILEVSCVLIVVTCLYLRPYKSNRNGNADYDWLNTLDAVLLTNLCFVVIFSSSIISDASLSVQRGLEKIVNVLAYVPLAYLLCLVCYYGWKYFCPRNLDFDHHRMEPEAASSTATGSTHQSQAKPI